MAIFRRGSSIGASNAGEEVAIVSQYMAPSRAVNGSTGKCNTPWQVYDTSRW